MQQAEEVFQLQQQHWRLADASWSLITLLQKAAATLASLGPQGPGLIRRLTPTPQGGSTKGPAALPLAGTANQSGELVCVLEIAGTIVAFRDDSMHASFIVCVLEIARKGLLHFKIAVCMLHSLYASFRLQGTLHYACFIHCMHA